MASTGKTLNLFSLFIKLKSTKHSFSFEFSDKNSESNCRLFRPFNSLIILTISEQQFNLGSPSLHIIFSLLLIPLSTTQHTVLKHPKIMGLCTQQPNYNHQFINKVFLTRHILANLSHLQGCTFQCKLLQTMSSHTFLLLVKFTINSNTAF